MFVSDEVRVDVSFAAASLRLADLAGSGSLTRASHTAWGEGLARVGPARGISGLSKLVHVQIRNPVQRDGIATLTLRWQATGAAGGLFPVLDADITVIPNGEQTVLIGLDGVYRPPGGAVGVSLDKVILHRVATATVHSFLKRIADAIAAPAPIVVDDTALPNTTDWSLS
jgi:hypothetical protein